MDEMVGVVVAFKQYYGGEEHTTPLRYCYLRMTPDFKQKLLAGDDDARAAVTFALFRANILLIRNGLTHQMTFHELESVPDEIRASLNIK